MISYDFLIFGPIINGLYWPIHGPDHESDAFALAYVTHCVKYVRMRTDTLLGDRSGNIHTKQ